MILRGERRRSSRHHARVVAASRLSSVASWSSRIFTTPIFPSAVQYGNWVRGWSGSARGWRRPVKADVAHEAMSVKCASRKMRRISLSWTFLS